MHDDIQLLLASKSPRRRQLVAAMGFPLRFVDVDVDEVVNPATPVPAIAEELACLKASAFPRESLHDNEILITADTVVALQDTVLGKPHDRQQAVKMLHSLSGRSHFVYTGVCLTTPGSVLSFTESTEVFFRPLSDDIVNRYVDEGSCMDKAGAYGIQDWFGMVGVERIVGCYYNVVGLPVAHLYKALATLIRKS